MVSQELGQRIPKKPLLSSGDSGSGGNGKGNGKSIEPEITDVQTTTVPGKPGVVRTTYTQHIPGQKPQRIQHDDQYNPDGSMSLYPPVDLDEGEEQPDSSSPRPSGARRSFNVPSVFEGTGPQRPSESREDYENRMRRQGLKPEPKNKTQD